MKNSLTACLEQNMHLTTVMCSDCIHDLTELLGYMLAMGMSPGLPGTDQWCALPCREHALSVHQPSTAPRLSAMIPTTPAMAPLW